MVHASREGFGEVFVVRVMVGIWWSRRVRRSSGKVGRTNSSGIVVHGACRLARRSKATEAGELAGSVRWNLEGEGES